MASVGMIQSIWETRGTWAAALVAIILVQFVGRIIYNVFFHPLRSYPGPTYMVASRAPYCWKLLTGTLPLDMLDLHNRYGEVVRIAPNELAFSSSAAWKEVMGHRSGEELGKSKTFYRPIDAAPVNIVNADREVHSVLRRQLAHGFSERSMREQEPLIKFYIDLLIQRLHENCAKSVDIAAWYNFTTFDIIGDLAFGEPFDCLKNSAYHPYVHMIFQSAVAGTVFQTIGHYRLLHKIFWSLIPKAAMIRYVRATKLSMEKLRRRMKPGNERPDLIEGLLRKKDELNLTIENLQANSNILIIGGSETTATLLAGVTYLLLSNPEALRKLTEEIRSTFKRESEINMTSVNQLTYMLACLNEALRIYPPVPAGLPRQVPPNGRELLGRFVPGKTIVAIHHWAVYHSESHFTDPFSYIPERFLGDPRFANDNFDALQPFHVGPRNCLGRNLAYAEMRLILARVVFNFDMKLAEESHGWMERQRIHLFWKKGPLKVQLTPVKR